uniref:Transferase, transferring glycosyl groups n=1 Tax=Solanum tuberosum TaxID=4113 RepID=M0ZPZ6_SOLTU
MSNPDSSSMTPLSQEVENLSSFNFSIPTPEESPSTPICAAGEMDESFTPQTELVASHIPSSDKVLVCTPTLVLSGNKSQKSEAQSVTKPGAELFSEEIEVGQMAVGEELETAKMLSKDISPATRADRAEDRKRKGKGKLIKAHLKGENKRYGTRSVTQKVLGSAMEANAAQTERIRKRRQEGSLTVESSSTHVPIDDNETQSEDIIRADPVPSKSVDAYIPIHSIQQTIRMARIVDEAFKMDNKSARWYIMAGDDTIFFIDNLVEVLSKYDHRKYFYVGMNSETHASNVAHSFNMAFGGGGYAFSYALVEAMVDNLDICIKR